MVDSFPKTRDPPSVSPTPGEMPTHEPPHGSGDQPGKVLEMRFQAISSDAQCGGSVPGPFLLFLKLVFGDLCGEFLPVILRDQGVLGIKVGTLVCRAQLSPLSYFPSFHISFRHFAGLGEMSVPGQACASPFEGNPS